MAHTLSLRTASYTQCVRSEAYFDVDFLIHCLYNTQKGMSTYIELVEFFLKVLPIWRLTPLICQPGIIQHLYRFISVAPSERGYRTALWCSSSEVSGFTSETLITHSTRFNTHLPATETTLRLPSGYQCWWTYFRDIKSWGGKCML